ncbi:potassium channel family protein [Oceanicaulis sp. LC35]|uniref:potassium channel family protein n=1 Tax=Oceanicaulis sp. LC35 TaxID=3349635 RepID=UPI003F82B5FB
MNLASYLLLSTVMVVLTTAIHMAGLAALIAIMRWREGRSSYVATAWWQMGLILGVMLTLFFLHAVEIWVYAALYRLGGVVDTFEAALYFSTSTFTTVGYGDIVLGPGWRVLAAIESANGFLLLGWSTAFLLQVVSRLRSVEFRWLDRREDEAELFEARKQAKREQDAD